MLLVRRLRLIVFLHFFLWSDVAAQPHFRFEVDRVERRLSVRRVLLPFANSQITLLSFPYLPKQDLLASITPRSSPHLPLA